MGQNHDLSDGEEKIENHILDFMKIDASKFDILFYIDISSEAFGKFNYSTSKKFVVF